MLDNILFNMQVNCNYELFFFLLPFGTLSKAFFISSFYFLSLNTTSLILPESLSVHGFLLLTPYAAPFIVSICCSNGKVTGVWRRKMFCSPYNLVSCGDSTSQQRNKCLLVKYKKTSTKTTTSKTISCNILIFWVLV